MDHIKRAPCWLLVDLCFSLANRRNQQKEGGGAERERKKKRETDGETGEWTEETD